jgi:hypothetical protein
MKNDEYEAYRPCLQDGMRVEVGIPLTGGGVFRDWGVIKESGGEKLDRLLIQLSRDVLPANVRIDPGFLLDVSVTLKKETYTCSGIVHEKIEQRVFWVQLFGPFNLKERRQFFRINVNMKLQYALVPQDESWTELERDWTLRKDLEHLKFQGLDEYALAAERARYGRPKERDWKMMLRCEVNLSGGGVGMLLPEPAQLDQFICLIVYVPGDQPREIQAVTQVLMAKPPEQRGRKTVYEVGMQFVGLDDKDREIIFQHISRSQIEYLRETAERRDPVYVEKRELTPAEKRRRLIIRVLGLILFLLLAYWLTEYLSFYEKVHPPNEIGTTYEKAIKQYRHLDE